MRMADGREEMTRPAGQVAERGSSSLRAPAHAWRGQALLEYALLLALVIAALTGMQLYAKRSLQAGIKTAADGLSPFGRAADPTGEKAQAEGLRYESGERRNRTVAAAGQVLERQSAVTTVVDRAVQEQQDPGGSRTRTTQKDDTSASGALGGGVSSRSKVIVEVQ